MAVWYTAFFHEECRGGKEKNPRSCPACLGMRRIPLLHFVKRLACTAKDASARMVRDLSTLSVEIRFAKNERSGSVTSASFHHVLIPSYFVRLAVIFRTTKSLLKRCFKDVSNRRIEFFSKAKNRRLSLELAAKILIFHVTSYVVVIHVSNITNVSS